MRVVKLTQSFEARVDDEDFWRCCQYLWHYHEGYGRTRIKGKKILLHRFIMNASPEVDIDHEDRNRLNCEKSNLRIASVEQNCQNRSPRGKFKGVYLNQGRWRAMIAKDHIGQYDTPEQAALAYDVEALKRYGRYAYLNFPKDQNGKLAVSVERRVRPGSLDSGIVETI